MEYRQNDNTNGVDKTVFENDNTNELDQTKNFSKWNIFKNDNVNQLDEF